MTWPGFVIELCSDCDCPGDVHQPVCVGVVVRNGRREYCGCPAYRCSAPQQIGLFKTQEAHSGA